MKKALLLATALTTLTTPSLANDRYKVVRPVIIESGIAGQWVMQLSGPVRPVVVRRIQPVQNYRPVRRSKDYQEQTNQGDAQQVAYQAQQPDYNQIEPQFLPQTVDYDTDKKPGTIIIDTNNRFLYLVMSDGKARRYGIGVGKPGFEWAGEHKITRKAEWPNWVPPKEMIAREAAKGHFLPDRMDGGEANPLGARAMYLGSTLYRIHGTNAPWTIGSGVSSGCIRMRNQDVVDLYERVGVGTRVVVM
ncbi:L,D-transpeptidase [Rhizobium sp. KVB221]|uniref:L,D-transpeptidase n=1 Tax=Rhizobium setariae TaxID=2801340 RepID=A0A937CKK9_9HYPH|nr:L,D-transpeptidase [Rhizobium setariae]MBL0370566.1 L,D-transpeptidase [Rhizobium setariae]